jgi:hypothetical protein
MSAALLIRMKGLALGSRRRPLVSQRQESEDGVHLLRWRTRMHHNSISRHWNGEDRTRRRSWRSGWTAKSKRLVDDELVKPTQELVPPSGKHQCVKAFLSNQERPGVVDGRSAHRRDARRLLWLGSDCIGRQLTRCRITRVRRGAVHRCNAAIV